MLQELGFETPRVEPRPGVSQEEIQILQIFCLIQ
jgi:hypothetical protein